MLVQGKAAQPGLQLLELHCQGWWQAGQALHGPAPTTTVCCWPCMALRHDVHCMLYFQSLVD